MEAGTIVDVAGVVTNVEPWAVITRKDGTETRKRSVNVCDDSGRSVEVSLGLKKTASFLQAAREAGCCGLDGLRSVWRSR